MNEHDIRFMQRALELARKGIGLASPNPTVGCVIVRGEHQKAKIAGEGFHQYDLRDHAEIVALKDAGENARGATAYITLEPCNITGRTGPCTQALLQAGITRTVVATEDPNPKIAGRGLEILRNAGVLVDAGACETEARELNYGFARWITARRPFVTLKSALTLDGQLTLAAGKISRRREWITSEESRTEVHKMRHAADAIITGIGTIVADDPLLTDRSGLPRRRRLLRIVVDSKLRLSSRSRIVKSADHDVLVFTAASLQSANAKKLQAAGVEITKIPARAGKLDLKVILRVLGSREILSAMLECGPRLNSAAWASRMVDRLVLFYAPRIAGHTKSPLCFPGRPEHLSFRQKSYREYGPDFAIDALLHDPFDS